MSKRISAFVCGVVEFREPFSRFYANPYSKSAYALGRKIARGGAPLEVVKQYIEQQKHK